MPQRSTGRRRVRSWRNWNGGLMARSLESCHVIFQATSLFRIHSDLFRVMPARDDDGDLGANELRWWQNNGRD
ncbi:MAG: hypothetical protein DWI22_20655 [Planctomycetota bacterium]|nr:MAG: hypothetical protein DWI22_20655 [Planctomycetota bacterium]